MIAERKLTAVTAIFNCNGQGQADYVSIQQSAENLAAKASAFGWQVATIDGHDPEVIKKTLTMERTRPLASHFPKRSGRTRPPRSLPCPA